MPSRSIIRTGVGPHREPGNPSRPWRRRSISSPRERLAFSRDETSVDPSARSSITPTQSLDSIVRGRALTSDNPPGFTHKGLRSYAWGGFGDVRLYAEM